MWNNLLLKFVKRMVYGQSDYLYEMKYLFFTFITSLIYGCSYQRIDEPLPAEHKVKTGEKFYISLPENHTTGYLWQLSNSYNETHLDYMSAVWHGNEKGIEFNFQALKPGKDTLEFYLIKYRDTTDVKKFMITVY